MNKESNKTFVESNNQNSIDNFHEENQIAFFIKEISLKGSLYLEDLNFSSEKLEEIKSQAAEMDFIIHLSKIGILIIDPSFLGGNSE